MITRSRLLWPVRFGGDNETILFFRMCRTPSCAAPRGATPFWRSPVRGNGISFAYYSHILTSCATLVGNTRNRYITLSLISTSTRVLHAKQKCAHKQTHGGVAGSTHDGASASPSICCGAGPPRPSAPAASKTPLGGPSTAANGGVPPLPMASACCAANGRGVPRFCISGRGVPRLVPDMRAAGLGVPPPPTRAGRGVPPVSIRTRRPEAGHK